MSHLERSRATKRLTLIFEATSVHARRHGIRNLKSVAQASPQLRGVLGYGIFLEDRRPTYLSGEKSVYAFSAEPSLPLHADPVRQNLHPVSRLGGRACRNLPLLTEICRIWDSPPSRWSSSFTDIGRLCCCAVERAGVIGDRAENA